MDCRNPAFDLQLGEHIDDVMVAIMGKQDSRKRMIDAANAAAEIP